MMGAHSSEQKLRIGSVSFLNAKPLIFGLEEDDRLDLKLEVPSRLLAGLQEGRLDVALLPVIDFQRLPGLRILRSGGIGCDGPTLTVRIFSPVPVRQINKLACDTDSHTSVALARVLLGERYGIRPEFVPLSEANADAQMARLLIGDKVMRQSPAQFQHQIDLGDEWKQQTGLPFVFAAWMARPGVQLDDLPARLERAKRAGLANVDLLVERFAGPLGWPAAIAREYLTRYLEFDIGPRHRQAIELFHNLAWRYSLLSHPPRDLEWV